MRTVFSVLRFLWGSDWSIIKGPVLCKVLYLYQAMQSSNNLIKEVLCAVFSCSVVSDSLRPHGLQPARLLCPWDSPDKNTGVGGHALLEGIFPTQGSNPGLPHCRQILDHLSHQGSPRILEWVDYPFSSGSSWLGNQTRVFCIAGRFFTSWASTKPKAGAIRIPISHKKKMRLRTFTRLTHIMAGQW